MGVRYAQSVITNIPRCSIGYATILLFQPRGRRSRRGRPGKELSAYDDLIRSLDKVLKDANFEELPHEQVTVAHRKRTLRVEVKAEHDDFREVRFYKRGRHVEQLEVKEWFGLRRREVEIEVFDDIVLVVAMKSQAEIGSRRELRILSAARLSRDGAAEIFPKYGVRRSLRSFSKCARRHELGQKRTCAVQNVMSALPPIADICNALADVR